MADADQTTAWPSLLVPLIWIADALDGDPDMEPDFDGEASREGDDNNGWPLWEDPS